MQENKFFKEFFEQKYNKEKNYKKIFYKTKGKRKKILNIATTILIILTIGLVTPTLYAKIAWNIEYKEYQNREVTTGLAAINEAIEDGYEENVKMNYVYQDGIGIKIDSLMITDDYYKMNVNIKFNENTEINTDTFSYGYAIYDDNNNIYSVSERITFGLKNKRLNYYKKLYKELGINYNKKDVYSINCADSAGMKILTAVPGNIISETNMTSSSGFPKSKKLYIRIFDLGYSMWEIDQENHKIKNAEDFPISNAEWILEISVPDKFYERESINLKLAEEVTGVKLNKAQITETGLVIKAEITGLRDLIMSGKDMTTEEFNKARNNKIFISDGDDNIYYEKDMGTTENPQEMKMSYDISKNNLDKRLYLNVEVDGTKHKIELVLDK